ncbi:MAG: ATP synthase F1 subunit gamma [Planctomycetes bacterium]|nr:ATP synthase F1 subunit gamma [Planctomycetota bacterium]
MAKARDFRRRIKSVRNTRKITRTMELVATAKAKAAQGRVQAIQPYARTLSEMAYRLIAATGAGGEGTAAPIGSATGAPSRAEARRRSSHPLLAAREAVGRVALVVLTANRGLCGGYNSGIIREARRVRQSHVDAGREVDLYVSGKKGIAWFRFHRVETCQTWTHIEDKPSFEDARAIADALAARFVAGEVDRVEVVACRYLSAGSQKVGLRALLPLEAAAGDAGAAGGTGQFLYEPDPATILGVVLPMTVRTTLYAWLCEAAVCEQIARRIAMKQATDAADEMVRFLTQRYNRARQAQITQEIAEIVGGAAALN